MSRSNIPITISFGDGIGTHIMMVALRLLQHVGAPLHIHTLEIGSRAYHHGFRYGIPASAMDKIMEYKLLLRAPSAPPENPAFKELDIPQYLECSQTITSNFNYHALNINPDIPLQGRAFINPEKAFAVFEPEHPFIELISDEHCNNSPCGMIMATLLMLDYLQLQTEKERIEASLTHTLQAGYCTADMTNRTDRIVSTQAFGDKLIEHLEPAANRSFIPGRT